VSSSSAASRASGCRRKNDEPLYREPRPRARRTSVWRGAEKVGDGGAPAGRPTTALDVPSPGGGRRELMAAGCVKKRGEDNVRREIYIKITIHIRV
jgi:hypothetical protein